MTPPRSNELLCIGTRGSRLALWQAERVSAVLRARHPGLHTEIVIIESTGDANRTAPVADLGQVGIVTREIEAALLQHEIDVAVHSLKDLPTESPAGLLVAALLPRDDPRDLLVAGALVGRGIADGDGAAALAALPHAARIGTSSLRRRAELLRARPDLLVSELRGNVPTRVAKIERGELDGTVLSYAGLLRLGLDPPGRVALDPDTMLPAPAQGTIAAQVREDDVRAREWVGAIDDRPTRITTSCERALLQELQGGCLVPLGALAWLEGERLSLRVRLLSVDGKIVLEKSDQSRVTASADLAHRVAADLRARGADRILADSRNPPRGGA
jgi:hydroxymethylbilane synthase